MAVLYQFGYTKVPATMHCAVENTRIADVLRDVFVRELQINCYTVRCWTGTGNQQSRDIWLQGHIQASLICTTGISARGHYHIVCTAGICPRKDLVWFGFAVLVKYPVRCNFSRAYCWIREANQTIGTSPIVDDLDYLLVSCFKISSFPWSIAWNWPRSFLMEEVYDILAMLSPNNT